MRVETISAPDIETAQELCPWACEIIEIEAGYRQPLLWKCFESEADVEIWRNQK